MVGKFSKWRYHSNLIVVIYIFLQYLSQILEECFQDSKSLLQYSLSKHINVSNALECQKDYCQPDNKCTAFVYNQNSKECFLKKPPKRFLGIVQLRDKKDSIFGPKHCQGL